MSTFTIPQHLHVVQVMAPAADAAGRNSDAVSLKNYQKAWVIASINQGNAATIDLTIEQCTKVDGTGAKALTNNVPIWANLDAATSDVPARATDAKAYTTDAALKRKVVIFQIDPASLDVAGGFDCVRMVTGASNAANITAATVLLEARYPNPLPLTARAD